MKKNELSVRLYGEPIGLLEQTKSGKKMFRYNSDAATPVSVGMPVRAEAYGEQQCEAFFGGLLPESDAAKQLIGKMYGISPSNSFALLKAIGYDCAGAISMHAIDDPVVSQKSVPLTGKFITDAELYKHIKELPQKPLFMDVEGLRLSLAGVQDKAAVCVIDNQIAFPENGCPTTHILKPSSPHFEGITENEYFSLKIAKRLGIPVPEVELKKIKDVSFLLVERYDRRVKDNRIERIHQEDFCQALSIPSLRKYENEGGPGFKECFALLNYTAQPAIDRNFLAMAVVFNYLLGNMDAHAKNFSLLHHTPNNIRLAPFYDMICTRAYPKLTSKMAMKIGNKFDSARVLPTHWEELCNTVNYRYLAMVNLIEKLGQQMLVAVAQEKEQLENPIVDTMSNVIERNIEKTLQQFKDAT